MVKGRQASLVGIVQCRSTIDRQKNFEMISNYVEQCVERGATFVCLPENFAY